MAAFFFAAVLPLSLTSCGGDDDDDNTPSGGGDNIGGGSNTESKFIAVDLGLPSGTKWADRNVGASSKTDEGDYFSWGEISAKSTYNWSTYKFKGPYNLTKYCDKSGFGKDGFTDNKTELDLSDDVARQKWGGSWRMPSKEQFEELLNNTQSDWTTVNGVKGRLFIGENGNSIFLPAAGYRNGTSLSYAGSLAEYWSRTLYAGNPDYAYYLYFGSSHVNVDGFYRYYGRTVRPVRP